MVVIFIIIVLAVAALPVVLGASRDRKFSESARIIQAALAGARDRAIVSGQIRGLRLVRNENDPWTVTTFVYVGVPEPYAVGRVYVSGLSVIAQKEFESANPTLLTMCGGSNPDPHWEFVDPGKDNQLNTVDDIPRVDAPLVSGSGNSFRGGKSYIRFASSGRTYRVDRVDNTTASGIATLILDPGNPPSNPPPYPLTDPVTSSIRCGETYQLFGPPQPLPGVVPTKLPDGIVIDVRGAPMLYASPFSATQQINIPRSRGIPNFVPPVGFLGADQTLGTSDDRPASSWPTMDILFGPNGQVTGDASVESLIHFWVGERGDKGPDPVLSRGGDNTCKTQDDQGPSRPHFLLTLNTRSGAVGVSQNPGTASADLWPPPVSATKYFYSDIYDPARQSFGVSAINVP